MPKGVPRGRRWSGRGRRWRLLPGADPAQVLFTSGGTESAAAILTPGMRRAGEAGATRLLVGAAEHPCVLEGHRFEAARVERVAVDGDGVLCLSDLRRRLDAGEGETVLLSLQAANNETGVIQPVAKAAALVRERGGLLHTDAVQAAGKMPLRLADLGADAVTLSAHKIGGPKGVGAVVLASDRIEIAERLLRGGGQERGRRAGTENLPGIVGFGAAAEIAGRDLPSEASRLAALRDEAEAELLRLAPDAAIFGRAAERLPNTLAFAVPGLKAETALILFDLDGVSVSSGSACSSGKVKRSHVLDAMGVEPALAEAPSGSVSAGIRAGRTCFALRRRAKRSLRPYMHGRRRRPEGSVAFRFRQPAALEAVRGRRRECLPCRRRSSASARSTSISTSTASSPRSRWTRPRRACRRTSSASSRRRRASRPGCWTGGSTPTGAGAP
jgi:cysteine desulfurase